MTDINPIPAHWEFICIGCRKTPSELECYAPYAAEEGISAEIYVYREEGTLNTENGHFLCDGCYFKAGAPSSPGGWKAP